MAHQHINREQQLKETYDQLAFEHDSTFLNAFFARTHDVKNEKMTDLITKWQQDEQQSFDQLLHTAKNDMLTKPGY